MKIIIVGDGKVGGTLAERLSQENHDITVIDRLADRLRQTGEQLDVMTVEGNGATRAVQLEAGVEDADLLIAATASDELNLLACLVARKSGAKHTIARIRDPAYNRDLDLLKDDLGLSMLVNPEMAVAMEISRLLRFPSAITVDTFAKGRVELLQIPIPDSMDGMTLKEFGRSKVSVLICAVERAGKVYIPSGTFRLLKGDKISFVASAGNSEAFLRQIGYISSPIREVMLVGGGRIGYYLAAALLERGMSVTIIEARHERCEELSELLPRASIICGNGTDQQLLLEEGLQHMDAFVALTGIDEENILMGLYAGVHTKAKVVTKLNRVGFEDVIDNLNLGSVFYPRYVAAEQIVRYVRAMQNSLGSNVETLYHLAGTRIEALEFRVTAGAKLCGIPLQQLHFRENLLIASINRDGHIIIPGGSDTIEQGDTVIVVTTNHGLNDLNDILARNPQEGTA